MIDVLLAIVIATCAAALGLAVLRVVDAMPAEPRDHLLAGLLAGLGLTSLLGLGLAAVGLLRWWWLGFAAVGALAVGGRSVAAAVRHVEVRRDPVGRILLAVCVLVVVAELPALLAPPVGGDQTWYALVYPRLYGTAGTLVPTPWTYWGQQQLLQGFLSAVAFALRGDVLARLLNLLSGLVAAAAIASLVERHLGRGLGAVAAGMFLTLPMTCALVLRTGPGLVLVAYATAATASVLDWSRTEGAGDLRRATLFAGLAAGSAMVGVVTPVVLALLVFALMVERAWPVGRVLATTVGLACLLSVVAGPWYVRNALQTGDPFHPYGEAIFHARHWSAAATRYLAEQREQYRSAAVDEIRPGPAHDVARLPWDLTMHPGSPRSVYDVGPFALAFLPAVVLLRRRRDRAVIVAATAVAFVAVATVAEPRAALPGVALAIAAGVPAAVALCGRALAAVVLAASLVANVATASAIDRRLWIDQVRTSVGAMSSDAFLRTHSPRFRFWERANAAIPPTGRVALLETTPHPYWVAHPFVLLSYLEQGLVDYRTVDTVDALAQALGELRVGWVAVDTSGLEASGDPFEASVMRLWRALLATQGQLVLRADGYALYALRPVTAVAGTTAGREAEEVAHGHALRGPQGVSVVCDLETTGLHRKVLF